MQSSISTSSYRRYAKGRFSRAALWLAMLVISLQLIAMAFHKHDLAEQDHDCVGCYLSAHVPTDLPMVQAEIIISLTVIAYRIALQPIYSFIAAQSSYLLPLPQAPPPLSSPV